MSLYCQNNSNPLHKKTYVSLLGCLAVFLAEKVAVQLLDLINRLGGNSYIVLNHQLGQRVTVHQDHLGRVLLFGVLPGLVGELCRRDKQALACALSCQRPHKLLNFGPTNGGIPIPSLCLYVDQAKAQLVLTDNAINTLISAFSDNLPRILHRAAISHMLQQLNHKSLKEARPLLHDLGEKIIRQCTVDLLIGLIECVLRRLTA